MLFVALALRRVVISRAFWWASGMAALQVWGFAGGRSAYITHAMDRSPNWLSFLSVASGGDVCVNCVAAAVYAATVVKFFGIVRMVGAYVAGGVLTSYAYLFQAQISATKCVTFQDKNSASNGAWCAIAAMVLRSSHPFFAQSKVKCVAACVFSLGYLARCVVDEYVWWRYFPRQDVPQSTN